MLIMARLRIHPEDESEDPPMLQLKTRTKQASSTKSRTQSPLKAASNNTKPKKQRVFKTTVKVDDNSVQLSKLDLPSAIAPSKFSRTKATNINIQNAPKQLTSDEQICPKSRITVSPRKPSRRKLMVDSDSDSDTDTDTLEPTNLSPRKPIINDANKSTQVLLSEDDASRNLNIKEPKIKNARRRLVIDSDSESDGEIDIIFVPQLPRTDTVTSENGSLNNETIPKTESYDLAALSDAFSKQGFNFQPSTDEFGPKISKNDDVPHSRPTTASGLDLGAVMTFEPPKSRSPFKIVSERPVTPPHQLSPTKLKLKSSTKTVHLPPSPHKPSSDEFWCPSAVNDWIDQYSPQKTIKSPSRNHFGPPYKSREVEVVNLTQPASPQKCPTKAQRQAKKDFNAQKHDIATKFLKELDISITGGRIAELSRTAGGVTITWSNKLNSTAGRAHWRKQEIRTKHSDGRISAEVKHTASIELAEKVIDEEHRLINTIAHEFCHLATFMIDGVKTNPHGKEFKEWAKKCSQVYGHRGVEVTTKHSYDIDYKYIWECGSCGTVYKRHSKSINPEKHRCGGCKSSLVQIKPPPRKITVSDYQMFVKEHFQRVKNLDKSASHGTIMEILGRLYREGKAEVSKKSIDAVDVLIAEVQDIQLENN
jgi:predicted SprT family Zn-dependent metalloprotease